MNSTTSEGLEEEELSVNFHPALFLQRRVWVLDILRREGISDILDVGCGEGQLLTVLCQPAPWLQPPDSKAYKNLSLSGGSVASETHAQDEFINLHPTRLAGLDVCSSDLEFAAKNTEPPPGEGEMRWEAVDIRIFKGGLEVFNPEFVDVECIVASEVIEHLPSHIYEDFAPMLLAAYHPKWLLLTTPSYTFNARFTRPGSTSGRKGFKDPTKRTDRVFRHDDHQFEWTVEEFEAYCSQVAEDFGYIVKTSSVGRALEIDDWGRDDELGGASLVAEFHRIDDAALVQAREIKCQDLIQAAATRQKHELMVTHHHLPHERSRLPQSLESIGESVKSIMEELREAFMRIEELWFQTPISFLCGGWMEFLILAVEQHDSLRLQTIHPQKRSTWQIELVNGVQVVPTNLWPLEAEADTGLDLIPHEWSPREEFMSSENEWDHGSTAEGDISWNDSASWESEVGSSSWAAQTEKSWSIENEEGTEKESIRVEVPEDPNPWSDEEIVQPLTLSGASASAWDGDDDSSTIAS